MPRNCIREISTKENEIFLWKMDPPNKEIRSPENGPSSARPCCSSLKMFLVALSFAYFAKALSGSYMKSTITQLERRFDIPSYLIGVIDGSFEIGNLLVIAFVSYFGAKLHRPKIIAIGCLLMSLGTFLIALPHFIIGRYKFETSIGSSVNSTSNLSPCPVRSSVLAVGPSASSAPSSGCEHESMLSMWIYVFLGNILRGIGETPVQPLGISYIDDYALEENAAFYIGCVQTISVIGPVFGYLLGSVCAKIYVDIGFVNMESISITPGDARWVGAWWLGYLIAGFITLLSAVPFWFLPKSLPLPEKRLAKYSPERTSFIKDSPLLEHKYHADEPANFLEMAKGVINIPAVALGMFSGGVIMKKFKLSIMGAAKFALGTSLLGYFLSLFFFAMGCENASVAGITRSYTGEESLYKMDSSLLASCNTDCQCPETNWDPVCGENGLTYFSPCLAGCRTSHGSGLDTVFEQCSCVAVGNHTASAGQCNNRDSCHRVFPYFLALSVITSFIISLGGTPGYMLLIRCIRPQLKSLALGFHTLTTRTLAGIPAPIYFGAIIDTTCLKWGQKKCGGRGACRIYNTTAYRIAYLGLTLGLRTASFFLCILGLVVLRRHVRRQEHMTLTNGGTGAMAGELQALRKEENNSCNSNQCPQTTDYDPERETRL
ncbi:solute carrier organic anion transporter family member 1C1-like isoform X2 [Carassius carassius]|uniref:solute carrier organic anion transporter family member 1C1-like isoform X2 n=1 Tax=Carassius carassius TaxID=217509 RepID=UPI002868F33D|nr:solute carrier organic anion transporter family member 1C1-like isoform X2 [Carassius carassius]